MWVSTCLFVCQFTLLIYVAWKVSSLCLPVHVGLILSVCLSLSLFIFPFLFIFCLNHQLLRPDTSVPFITSAYLPVCLPACLSVCLSFFFLSLSLPSFISISFPLSLNHQLLRPLGLSVCLSLSLTL